MTAAAAVTFTDELVAAHLAEARWCDREARRLEAAANPFASRQRVLELRDHADWARRQADQARREVTT